MRDKVLRLIASERLLEQGDKVIVAVSGGADSTALLHIIISIKELYDLTIYAFHFNHMIRGEEADRDEDFVRRLCGSREIPFTAVRRDVPRLAAESGESVELCGRRLRYAALAEVAESLGGAKIATAHHRGDNTETVLLNLIRGTGVAGLGGIPVRRGGIIRPLLRCSREEIEAYCRDNGLDYVNDSTNLDDAYTRNKLRLHILPAMRELNPSLDEGVERMASLMRDADEYLNKISVTELNQAKIPGGYSCERLLTLDRAVLTYAVKNVLADAGAPADSLHIGLVADAMRTGGAVDLGRGCRAECAQGILRVVQAHEVPENLCVPFAQAKGWRSLRIADGAVYSVSADGQEIKEKVHKKFLQNCIPCAIITGDTIVRHRRAGDTFTDPRRGVTKTLKKLLNELKIPREQRDSLTLVAEGSTVLWIEGVGVSKQAQIPEDYRGDVCCMNTEN